MTTGTTAVTFLTRSAVGLFGFLTRPNAVSAHSHFQFGFVGTLTSEPYQVTEFAPNVLALATVAPVGYVPTLPPVQPVKLVAVVPVHVTAPDALDEPTEPDEPSEMVLEPEL